MDEVVGDELREAVDRCVCATATCDDDELLANGLQLLGGLQAGVLTHHAGPLVDHRGPLEPEL